MSQANANAVLSNSFKFGHRVNFVTPSSIIEGKFEATDPRGLQEKDVFVEAGNEVCLLSDFMEMVKEWGDVYTNPFFTKAGNFIEVFQKRELLPAGDNRLITIN